MEIRFAGYTFNFWLLTTRNRYDPEDFEIAETGEGIRARANYLSFGEQTGRTEGSLEITFSQHPGGVSWAVQAEHAEPIRGVKVAISPFPVGKVMVPIDAEFTLEDGAPGRCFSYPGGYYPIRHISSTGVEPAAGPIPIWAAQLAIIRAEQENVIISAREYPPRVKKLWVYRKGNRQEIQLYTEADACRRSTSYSAPVWTIERSPNWQQAASAYASWMSQAFSIAPFEQRIQTQPWLKDIQLVVIFHGAAHDGKIGYNFDTMAARLVDLARLFPAERVLVKLAGFEGPIDRVWPDARPAHILGGKAAFERLVSTAHSLGYRLMPHLNVWGASYENPRTRDLLPFQIIDPEGRPSTWSYDYDMDEIAEEIFAYISPDAPAWREIQQQNIGWLVAAGMDAIYLDQTGTFINDLRHDHFRGLRTLYSELSAAFPVTQFAGEAPVTEVTASLCSLICGIHIPRSTELAELYRILFLPYIRNYGYNLPPEPYRGVWGAPNITEAWNEEQFRRYEERSAWVNGIPTLNLTDQRIRLVNDLGQIVLNRARQYRMV